MQRLFQVQQTVGFVLRQLRDGDMRPRSHDLRDLFCTDLTLRCGAAILPGFALGLHVGTNGALFITNLCCALKVLMRDGLFLFLVELLNLGF